MKFLAQTLTLAAMTFTSAEARKIFTKDEFNQAVAGGKYDSKKLLRHAVPLKPDGAQRRADESEYFNEEYPRLELTSDYKIQFNTCLTMETENYNLMMDNLISYAKDGTLVSVRNYVLFDICNGDGCVQQTYVVDLPTFIEAVMDYGPSRQDAICEACETYGEEVCGDAYVYNHNGRGLLQYDVFNADMCGLCEQYECWEDTDGDQQMDFDAIEEWIASIAECSENSVYWQGLTTYSGWMCNTDGSGIEIGVFLDSNCRMYNKNLHYVDMMQDQDYQYYYQSQNIVPSLFQDILDCRDMTNVEFVDEDTYETYKAANSTGDGTVNDACTALFNADFVPRSTTSCGQKSNWTAEEWTDEEENDANADQYNNENGQNMYQYIQAYSMTYNNNGQDNGWYTYDLSAYEVMDEAAICEKIVSKWTGAGYSTGQSAAQYAATNSSTGINNVFSDSSSTNAFWKWNGKQTISSSSSSSTSGESWLFPTRNNHSSIQTANATLSPLEIASIVLACVAFTALFMHVTRKLVLKRRIKKGLGEKEVYVKTDDHGQPLIIS